MKLRYQSTLRNIVAVAIILCIVLLCTKTCIGGSPLFDSNTNCKIADEVNIITQLNKPPIYYRNSPVLDVSCDPEGRFIASVDADGIVTIWDRLLGKVTAQRAFSPIVEKCCWSSRNHSLLLWGSKCVFFWKPESNEIRVIVNIANSRKLLKAPMRFDVPDQPSVVSATISHDGEFVAWCETSGDVRVHRISSGTQLKQFSGSNPIFHPRRFAILFSREDIVYLHDLVDGNMKNIGKSPGSIRDLQLSSDGKIIGVMNNNGAICCLQEYNGIWKLCFELPKSGNRRSFTLSPTGSTIALIEPSSVARIVDINTGKILGTIEERISGILKAVFSPTMTSLFLATESESVREWMLRPQPYSVEQGPHHSQICSLSFSSDEKYLASGGGEGGLGVWELETKQCIATLRPHRAPVSFISFDEGKRTITTAGWDRKIVRSDPTRKSTLLSVSNDSHGVMRFESGATHTEANRIQIYVNSGISVIDNNTLREIEFHRLPKSFERVVWSSKRDHLLTSTGSGIISICSSSPPYVEINKTQAMRQNISDIAYSHNADYFASSSYQIDWPPVIISVYESGTCRQVAAFSIPNEKPPAIRPPSHIYTISFIGKNALLCCGTPSGEVIVWDINLRAEFARYKVSDSPVTSILGSRVNAYIAVGCANGSLFFIKLKT